MLDASYPDSALPRERLPAAPPDRAESFDDVMRDVRDVILPGLTHWQHPSFFGYFPAHQPKFIVFLFVKEPHGVEYASASLAHPFGDIAKFLINYYDLPPDR